MNRTGWLLSVLLLLGAGDAVHARASFPGGPRVPPVALILAQQAPAESSDWLYYVGALVVLGVIGALVAVALQPQKNAKSGGGSGGITFTAETLGNYRLLNLMMTGQTSQVWEATEISSGRHFAIKLLLPECAGVKEHRQFLFHEAEVGKALEHPNIIRVAAIIRDPKHPHFVMDFFPGGNLKGRILHKENDFIREHALNILKQTATALAFINAKGWVHRDIKPDNILVNSSGEARVIDLAIAQQIPKGLARLLHSKRGKIQGTRSYMSPEQIRNEMLDARADIYSFGATAYEMVTGRPPFRAGSSQDLLNKHLTEKPMSPKSFNPDLTDEFCDLVLKMLAKKREQRPNNFHEILMALKKIRVFKPGKKTEAPQQAGLANNSLPPPGSYVMTKKGKARVVSLEELAKRVMVQFDDGTRTVITPAEIMSRL